MPRPLVVTAPLVFTTLLALACHGPGKPVKPGDAAAPTDIKALATFDPAALGPGAPPKPGPSRPLDVLDYGPEGRSEGFGEIHVRFNKPVVALELADKTGLEKHFSFDPPLPGTASWKSPDLLVFTPTAALQPCTGYTARFTGGLVDLDGQRFERPLTWTFETPRPTVTRSLPVSLPVSDEAEDPADGDEGGVQRRDRVVLVEFDRPVDLKEARAHITAAARPIGPAGSKLPGKPVAVRVRRPSKKEREQFYGYDHSDLRELVAVQAATLWPGAHEIVVSVTPGLRSESGPLALDTPWSMVFRTYSAQAVVHMGCPVDDPCGLEPITLRLRNPIEDAQLRKITVTPRPKFLTIESQNNWGEGGSEVVILGQFVPETTYTVHVPASLRDIYGQSIPGGATRSARIAARPTVALSDGSGILRTGKAQTIGVESRHVKSVRVRLGIFTDEEYQQIPAGADHRAIKFPARVLERSYPLTPSGKAEWSSLAVDLADLSGDLRRPVLLEVSAAELTDLGSQQPLPDLVRGLFHLTDLGPIATVSLPASSVQVLRLSDGQPVPGARISRPDPNAPAKLLQLGATDRDGLLALPAGLLPAAPRSRPTPGQPALPPALPLRLTVVDPARDDHAHIELAAPYLGNSPAPSPDARPSPLRPGERLIARVVSERGVYRPGEKVRVVGWSAVDTPFARSNLGRLKAGTPVVFTLKDPFRKEVATHATKTSAEGKFWAELSVPADAALGRYTVTAEIAGTDISARVKVEDYRVPEYTVAASARRSDILHGETVGIDVHASYYFGGPVQISRVSRNLECNIQSYRPPGLEDIWRVGEPTAPETRHRNTSGRVVEPPPVPAPSPGHRAFELGCNLAEPRYPVRCNLSVEVQDASMQGIGAEASFAVHPASFYLALAAPRGWHEAGEQGLTIPARAVAIAGERVAVRGATLAITRHWRERAYKADGGKQVFNGWAEREEPIKTCKLDLPASGADPSCSLPTLLEGRYELAIAASEAEGRRVAHTLTSFEVYPKTRKQDHSWRSAPIERLEVLTDKRDVHPGDTLEVAVRGPWPGAHGNLVVARGGIRETHPIVLTDKQHIFTFTVDDTWTPAVYFEAIVVQPAGPQRWRPEVERASTSVRQDFGHRRLKVAVDAPAKAGPGQQVELAVSVRDEQDRPTVARVALWATDEAVLSLTNHEIPDLLPTFVPSRTGETHTRDDYRSILYPYIANPDDPWFSVFGTAGSGSGYGNGAGGSMGGKAGVAPSVAQPARSRFETTPVFLADLAVDATGEARVKARLPDNLTTFRITAVASARLVDGASPGRFGKNDTLTVVTAPLVLRAALPRQLRPGDTAELAAIVQNNTGQAGRLSVHAKVVEKPGTKEHVLKLLSPETATTELADGGQARLTFDIAALGPGAPEFELQASLAPDGGGAPTRDGLRLPLPVEAERTLTERVAAYGTIADDQAVAIPIRLPAGVLPGHGGVTVATTSTLLGGLEDAVHALVQYPYGCVEQTSSRLLPLTVLGPLGRDYPLGIPDTTDFMKVGIDRILAMQTDSGGFAYWPGGKQVHVYASAYATWVLQLARQNGHPVPELALGRALDDLERRVGKLELSAIPVDWGYSDGVRVAIALHTLADAGRDTSQQAAALFTLRQRLPLFARAFLLMALHRSDPQGPAVRTLGAELLANIRELQLTAHTGEDTLYELDEFFTSDGRSDAIVLMALLRVQPRHAIVPKLAAGLLERRLGGVWRNTQENAYALVALADYARIYEAELPDFQARAWVAGANILDARFRGRELATRSGEISMAKILNLPRTPGEQLLPVILQRQGQGRLYYRLGAEWAPSQAELPAREQGFSISRTLRTAGGAATTSVAAGEPIAMDITLTSHTRVRYVVLDLPLPAGLEGVSRTLGRGRGAAVLGGSRGWWVSHEEQRPDRVVVFADDLPPGTHHHTVDLRSTSRGAFSFPPALAEAMYMPEVYGRSAGARLTVR